MFHFFPRFAKDVNDSPFATELRRTGAPHRLFAEELNRQYATRAGLVLRVYPLLFFCAARAAVRSLILSRPKPDAVVVTSDVEAIVFGVFRAIFSRRTSIVFETFIATERSTPLARWLHHRHYSFVLQFVDVAISHSAAEARDNAAKFAGCGTRFTALPYALSVNGRDGLRQGQAEAAAGPAVIVTAGRSGRDFPLLAKAIEGLPCELRVICDWERPTQGLERSPQVTVLRQCFGVEYLSELARAQIVVVPLSQRNVSAGQMVLLQAFALGKPVVITDTRTTREYVVDGEDALVSAYGDAADLRSKILTLLEDDALRAKLGARAAERYDESFSTEAYVRKLVVLLREHTGEAANRPALEPAGQFTRA